MDELTSLLFGTRSNGADFTWSELAAPWALRFDEQAPLTLVTALRGDAWILPAQGPAVYLPERAVALVTACVAFRAADAADSVELAGAVDPVTCLAAHASHAEPCAPTEDSMTVLLTATYDLRGDVCGRMLNVLPPVLVVAPEPGGCPIMSVVVDELSVDRPGRQLVLDRSMDLLLVATIREWFDRPDGDAPLWYRAMADQTVGHALRLIHDDPAHAWTVAKLADQVGISRAALAKRFTALVGESPIGYLTGWRLSLAADLLVEEGATVAAVARRVGYANPYAFSEAFKRVRGERPSHHRQPA